MFRKQLGITLILAAFLLLFISMGISLNRYSVFKQVFSNTCERVREKVFLPEKIVIPWYKLCIQTAKHLPVNTSRQALIYKIRQKLAMLEVSHLYLNDPVDEKLMWSGIQRETGLRTRNLNGNFYVVDVKNESPSSIAKINFGDKIVSINGDSNLDYDKIKYTEGEYLIQRKQKVFSVLLKPTEVKVDEAPEFKKLDRQVGILKISSFRSEYFSDESWKEKLNEINNFKVMVVDLRDNFGGNFVSMLRAISPFFCGKEYLGTLGDADPRIKGVPFKNDLSDDVQYRQIQDHSRIVLESFPGYGCYKGQAFVLINENTGSVAEIFAHTLKQKNRAKLIGLTTSGQVLLAVWYSVPLLGKGYTLSIPEANYFDLNEESFEGFGVDPDFSIDYLESDLSLGRDSFIEEVYSQILNTTKQR
ncbi:MAG: hypothetical protein H6625_07030 [Bdellovibrionaceae bacterium]|nr:hypothetical protein [Pseudobdellovibrionaceae bacterium]